MPDGWMNCQRTRRCHYIFTSRTGGYVYRGAHADWDGAYIYGDWSKQFGVMDGMGPEFRGLLGADSDKFKVVRGKTLLWASGDRASADAKWYDFTGAPMPAEELQFGIGQDDIKAIDDPVFVAPDDPRLLELPISSYRSEEKPETNDDIVVIGYEVGGDYRAYPTALLDEHELVNDLIGGKPLTVGW